VERARKVIRMMEDEEDEHLFEEREDQVVQVEQLPTPAVIRFIEGN